MAGCIFIEYMRQPDRSHQLSNISDILSLHNSEYLHQAFAPVHRLPAACEDAYAADSLKAGRELSMHPVDWD